MGCCYSWCKEDISSQVFLYKNLLNQEKIFCYKKTFFQIGEVNERTHLLVDPVSNNANITQANR